MDFIGTVHVWDDQIELVIRAELTCCFECIFHIYVFIFKEKCWTLENEYSEQFISVQFIFCVL